MSTSSPPPSYLTTPGRSNLGFVPDADSNNTARKPTTTNSAFSSDDDSDTIPKTLHRAESGDYYKDSNPFFWSKEHFVQDGSSEEYDSDGFVGSEHEERQMENGSVELPSTVEGVQSDIEQNKEKIWDVFEETPWENLAEVDRKFWSKVYITSRIIVCVLLFLCVLAASSASLFSILLIVFNIDAAPHNYTLSSGQVLRRAGNVIDVRWVWAAMIVTSAPYVFTLFSCVHKLCVKRTRRPALGPLLTALGVETLHSVGLGAFVLVVAPAYDPLMVIVMMQTVCILPACLQCSKVQRQKVRFALNVTALVSTLLCLALLVYRLHLRQQNLPLTITTPVSLLLLSVEWWENFIPIKRSWKAQRKHELRQITKDASKPWLSLKGQQTTFRKGSFMFRLKYAIRDSRTQIEAWCAVWKIFLNLTIPLVVFAVQHEDCASVLYYISDRAENCSLWKLDLQSSGDGGWCQHYLPFVVAAASIVFSGMAFKAAKVACKINAQKFCFALPLTLSAPVTFVVVLTSYRHGLRLGDCQGLKWPLLMEDIDLVGLVRTYTEDYWLVGLMALGWIAFSWTLLHVWRPSGERVASTGRLFVRPLYSGVLLGQSLMLNRAVDDTDIMDSKTTSSGQKDKWRSDIERRTRESEDMIDQVKKEPRFPMIYACATMWHETSLEMTQLLKSLFRMDKDQFKRECTWRKLLHVNKDFYRYEAHIFFDDAFVKTTTKSGDTNYTVNDYVKTFTKVAGDAVREIYPPNVYFPPPAKTETPYGGRLTYQLPGTNLMVVHLKNKYLIRNKKRWSQVMYMYYLLSYKLLLSEESVSNKKKQADNTFLLALDGDVNFHPEDVQLLVDRMKKNKKVGAACGRIHPIGSGLLVMYQKFEYAVSHWLQKATEHIFGCVLCSPGCFSLFRGSALMDDNVLRRYATVSTTAKQAVQYDMGEDRWLCTLLLQQGKRVEYAAAADVLTFCPDSFQEFYKQRRRWTPSTMANILDLLMDWRHVTKVNDSISFLFIAYQIFLFVSSLVTPGTIFLLILGAFNTAYPSMPLYGALLINLLPVVLFICACFFASADAQMTLAMGLSTLYSFLMMVVLVGLLRQITENGMCSITAIFFVGVAGIFLLAALLHPQEMSNILYSLLYFLAIPSMSMLLVFFVMANLNVVSWGTRDNSPQVASSSSDIGERQESPPGEQLQGQQRKAGQKKKREDDVLTSEYTFSFGNLFKCMCCPTKKQNDEVAERFESVKNALVELGHLVENEEDDDDKERVPKAAEKRKKEQTPVDDTLWYEQPELGVGDHVFLPPEEVRFWEQLIETYLKPLDQLHSDDKHRGERMAQELTTLRNKTAMLFFIGNALFVAVIFILETVSEYTPSLTLRLPCDHSGDIGQKIEPISVTFTVVFGILLVLQSVGMFLHRFSTFVHIVAATVLPFGARKKKDEKDDTDSDDDFRRFGRPDPYLDLTEQFIHWHSRRFSIDSKSSRDSNSADTIRSHSSGQTARANIMSKLLERQKSMKRSQLHPNLYSVVDEELGPAMEMIEKENPPKDQGGSPATNRDGREGKAEEPGTNISDDTENEKPRGVVVSARLRWLRGRSINAILSLAKDPERLKQAKQRTQVEQRWIDTVQKVRQGQRRQNFADITLQAMQNQKLAAKQTSGQEGDKDKQTDDGDNTARAAAQTTVTFEEEKEGHSAAVPPPRPLRSGRISKWDKVKAAELAIKATSRDTPTSDNTDAAPTTTAAVSTSAATDAVSTSAATDAVSTSAATDAVSTSAATDAVSTSATTAAVSTSKVTAAIPTSILTEEVPTSTVTEEVPTSTDSKPVPSPGPKGLLKNTEADSPTADVTEF